MHLQTPMKTTSCFSPLVSRFVFSVMNGGFHCILLKAAGLISDKRVEELKRHYESWLVFLTKRRSHAPLKTSVSPHKPKLSFDLSTRGDTFLLSNPPILTYEY